MKLPAVCGLRAIGQLVFNSNGEALRPLYRSEYKGYG